MEEVVLIFQKKSNTRKGLVSSLELALVGFLVARGNAHPLAKLSNKRSPSPATPLTNRFHVVVGLFSKRSPADDVKMW